VLNFLKPTPAGGVAFCSQVGALHESFREVSILQCLFKVLVNHWRRCIVDCSRQSLDLKQELGAEGSSGAEACLYIRSQRFKTAVDAPHVSGTCTLSPLRCPLLADLLRSASKRFGAASQPSLFFSPSLLAATFQCSSRAALSLRTTINVSRSPSFPRLFGLLSARCT